LRLLADTHVLIWWSSGKRLTEAAADAIRSPDNQVFVSAASVWEAEIKATLGKLRLEADLRRELEEHGFVAVEITVGHAMRAARLPLHHQDPFDRMLVAQAQLESLTLVTRDPRFRAYDVPVLPA
jgi:PIN domain nuclease of toxin-antitoxin system